MVKKDIIALQVRLPEKLHNKIRSEAEEMGIPLNSHLIELLHMGIKLEEAQVTITPKGE